MASPTIATVGYHAPEFKASALVGEEFKTISLSDYKGKYVVLFFYPLDFTFVCPTEILAFSDRAAEFQKIGVELIGASVDSVFSHLAWVKQSRKDGGLGGALHFPLIGDITKEVSTKYGALLKDTGHTLRALYIIDKNQVVRQITLNDAPVGRSVDETLRLVQAFQFVDEHGEVCPVNWKPGSATIVPDPVKSKTFFAAH